jgi:hypothetical protein
MAKGDYWGRYGHNGPTPIGGFLDSLLQMAAMHGKGWSAKGGGGLAGGGTIKGKGKSKGQGKNGMDWGQHVGTDGGRPQWVCTNNGCDTENRMGRVACRICWTPRPKGIGRGSAEGIARQNSAAGADSRKHVLGIRGEAGRTTSGKGTARTAGTTAATRGPGGSTPQGGGGPNGGQGPGDVEGYTVVNYRAGDRPRVQPYGEAGKQNKSEETGAGKGRGASSGKHEHTAQAQKPENGGRREWYEIEDDPEMLCEEWDGQGEEGGEGGGQEEEEPEGPSELEQATSLVQIKKEMHSSLREKHGRGHAVTKKAMEELREAEDWLRQVKGPRPWWQEATRLQGKKAAMERAQTRVGEKMDAEKEWFQGIAEEHEERMEAMHEQWDDYAAKIRECESKLEEIRRDPSGDAADDDAHTEWATAGMPREEATIKMRDIAGHLVRALETVSGNERAENLLNALGAQLGELEGLLKPTGDRGGKGQGKAQQASAWDETWPQLEAGKGRSEGKGGKPLEVSSNVRGDGKGGAADVDRGDQNAQHKWARRGTRRGRGENEAPGGGAGQPGGGDAMEDVWSSPKAEAASRTEEAAGGEAQRQRVLDRIRARIQQEKTRKAAELQAKAAEEGGVPEPHLLSKEQLEENQRKVEAANREVEAEAERELASMSKEQLARVLEEDWPW